MERRHASPPATRIEARGVSKRFGGTLALDHVDLEIRSGELHAIVGENGAGKSTLMKILSGAIADFEGELILNGASVRFKSPRDAEASGIAIIYQELNLVGELTAAANIFLGREKTRAGLFLDDRAMEREANALFERLGARIPSGAKARSLRVGDQQLIEIARALSLDADIVIMDEPTSALSEAETERLFDVIAALKKEGVTILYISHKMNEVFRIADRITVLRDGRKIRTVMRDELQPADVVRLMVGREIAALPAKESHAHTKECLRVEGLSLERGTGSKRQALRDVSFKVERGEIVGVAGLLGAGRTELLECLFGAARGRVSGSIALAGKPKRFRQPGDAIAAGIAMVTEDRKSLGLFTRMNVRENVTICALQKLTRWLFLPPSGEQRVASEMSARLRLKAPSLAAPIGVLSGGNQQKAILARWLLTRPSVLLLDEPTRGIDVGAKAEIYVLLRELCAEGIAIVMTSSELPELLSVCDRILVLCEGRLAADLPRAQATEEAIMHAATSFAGAN